MANEEDRLLSEMQSIDEITIELLAPSPVSTFDILGDYPESSQFRERYSYGSISRQDVLKRYIERENRNIAEDEILLDYPIELRDAVRKDLYGLVQRGDIQRISIDDRVYFRG
jgi:hypothetical protein